jgi:tetratricopeptide (TPR) repeat protein
VKNDLSAARPGSSGAPVFVGRTEELAALESALDQVMAGQGRLLFVVGEPGIGKTAMLSEFLRRARHRPDRPFTLCRGRCAEQYGASEAYLPYLDAIGTMLMGRAAERTREMVRTYAPTWSLQLPAVFSGDAEALQRQTVGASRDRMLREMGELFEVMDREFPVLMLGEDFHWADPASVDLLRYLAGRFAHRRILIVVTLRDAGLETSNPAMYRGLMDLRPHGQEIRLGRLPPSDLGPWLDSTFAPNRFPPEFKDLLERRTEGHPLFLGSLTQFLRERGDIVWNGQAFALARPLADADVPAPENVRGMIRRSLDTLPEADRTALQHASVLGREFLSSVLAGLLEPDDLPARERAAREIALEERLSSIERNHHLLVSLGEEELPDGALAVRYRFTHSLYPEVFYEDLVSTRRHNLHKRAALVLTKRFGERGLALAAPLALHFEKGRDFPSAITWRVRAADNAAARYLYAEAIEHCDRAVSLLERVEEKERARLSLLLHEKRGSLHHALGRFDLAIHDFTLMRERARAAQSLERECDALLGLSHALFFARRGDEMAVRAHEAVEVAARTGSPPRKAAARLAVAFLLQDTGELAQAEALLDPLVDEARALGPKSVLMGALFQRGSLHYWRSEYAAAEARLREALALATETRDGFTALVALMLTGISEVNLGRVAEGRKNLLEGVALARRNGESFWLVRLLGQVGWLHRELQDFERARELDREAVRVARETGARWAPEPDALLSLFLDDARSGAATAEAAEARALFEQAASDRTLVGWFFEIRKESAFAEHYAGREEWAAVREHAQRLLRAASEKGTPTYGVMAHKLLADAALAEGRPKDAEASIETALDLLRVHPCPLIAWRTWASVGRLRVLTGDADGARAAWQEAARIVREIAASVDDEPLQRRFLLSPAVREILAGERG